MPYGLKKRDVILYDAIAEPRLIDHIDRVGVVLYSREHRKKEVPR